MKEFLNNFYVRANLCSYFVAQYMYVQALTSSVRFADIFIFC